MKRKICFLMLVVLVVSMLPVNAFGSADMTYHSLSSFVVGFSSGGVGSRVSDEGDLEWKVVHEWDLAVNIFNHRAEYVDGKTDLDFTFFTLEDVQSYVRVGIDLENDGQWSRSDGKAWIRWRDNDDNTRSRREKASYGGINKKTGADDQRPAKFLWNAHGLEVEDWVGTVYYALNVVSATKADLIIYSPDGDLTDVVGGSDKLRYVVIGD